MQIFMELFENIGFIIEGGLFLALAVLVFWFETKHEGGNLRVLLTEKDNPAVAVSLCGFLGGCVIAFTGGVAMTGGAFWSQLSGVAKYSLIILVLQVVADYIGDKLIFHELAFRAEIVEKRNVAAAVGKAAISVATGFILAGAFSAPKQALWLAGVWFLIGQLLLIAVAKFYQKAITPYDDMAEIRNQNLAAGFALAGVIIAVGYTVGQAIEGEFESWLTDLGGVVLYIVVSLILLWLVRLFTAKIILPKSNLSDEIAKDKNIGAGLIEGSVYILTAMIIGFFLT